MKIIQVKSTDKKNIRKFLMFPFQLYKDNQFWVPPLRMDERFRFNRKRNPFFSHSDAAFFLAMDSFGTHGRLAIIENRLYNLHNNEKTAFFYLFESENDDSIVVDLFRAAIAWAKERGLNKIIGPKGFTALDGFGMLVEGFEHRPALGIPYNLNYYPSLIEKIGFIPSSESVSGYLSTKQEFPERIHELSQRIQQRRCLSIKRFKSRSELKPLINNLFDLYSGVLQGTEEATPITREEIQILANQILWFSDPSLLKLVVKADDEKKGDDKLVGFLLAYPDISRALQQTKGKLFPFGWISIMHDIKKTDWININGAGLIEEYRGLGGTAILFSEMKKSVSENNNYQHADIVQIGLENSNMQREMENFGIVFYKKHRTYQLNI